MNERNGHEKAFELTRPKTPEEIAEETTRSMMPKLRRACSKDKRLKRNVGAKWLFDKISDDSFMDCFGGNSRGKLWTTLRDLKRRYGHDEQTLSVWAKKLEEAGWIWIQRGWPVWCFAISGVTQQPDLFSPEYARIRARADKTVSDGFVPESDKTADSEANNHESPIAKPSVTVSETVSDGQQSRESRFHPPSVTAPLGGESRFHPPSVTAPQTVSDGLSNRQSRVGSTVSHGHNRETPREEGALESLRGPIPPLLQEWKSKLRKLFPRELQDIKTKLLEQRRTTAGVQARLFINAKIKVVDELMLGPTPPGDSADRQQGLKPARLAKGPAMSPEEMKRRWVAAAKGLPPTLKQKAAVKTAA